MEISVEYRKIVSEEQKKRQITASRKIFLNGNGIKKWRGQQRREQGMLKGIRMCYVCVPGPLVHNHYVPQTRICKKNL